MHSVSSSCTFLLAAVLAVPAGAQPDRLAHPVDQLTAPATVPQTQAPHADKALGMAAVDDALDSARGGSDRTTIDTTLNGSVGANTATNVTTGSNIIQSGSFASMAGIPIVVQNTGANVLIQNATVINLQLK
jgi:hypothetical protein